MPKSHRRRNAAEDITGRFRQVFRWRRAVFVNILEMAVREARQRYFPALAVQKPRSGSPADDGAYGGHGHPGDPCAFRERLETILRDGAQNLVIVATGDNS